MTFKDAPKHLETYFKEMEKEIKKILKKTNRTTPTHCIFDTTSKKGDKAIALSIKQLEMKKGEIVQIVLGNYPEFQDLKTGDTSGLDIKSDDKKIIIELKMRTNTDNASARKTNYDKLSKFKLNNPTYECVYGCVNDDTEIKTLNGSIKTITHNNVEIKRYTGIEIFKLVCGDDYNIVIVFIKYLIDTYN